MAKVKIKNLNNVKKSVDDMFNEIRKDNQLLLDIGNKTVELTKAFNRSGKSPNGKRHPDNSDAWDNRREQLKAVNKTSEFYKAYYSNVTFTGQLIDSIKLIKINRNESTVEIDATGNRKPYKNLDGSNVKGTPTNKKLVEYLADIGRNIFGINKQIENVINKIVRSYMVKEMKKRFPGSR